MEEERETPPEEMTPQQLRWAGLVKLPCGCIVKPKGRTPLIVEKACQSIAGTHASYRRGHKKIVFGKPMTAKPAQDDWSLIQAHVRKQMAAWRRQQKGG